MKNNNESTLTESTRGLNPKYTCNYPTTLSGDVRAFTPTDLGYVLSRQINLDIDTLVNAVGSILCYKLSHLYSDRTFSITYFLGFSNLSTAKSLGFEVKGEFERQGIGSVVFMVYESPHFSGYFDVKFRVTPTSGNSTENYFEPGERKSKKSLLTRDDYLGMNGKKAASPRSECVNQPTKNSSDSVTDSTEHALNYLATRGVFIYG